MIGGISRKLHSQRGASMLLALLFLLICSMVTASILMAAVANAGKHRSNLEEHQVYLALSSAVSTLCDELNRCEYRGQYKYWETTEDIKNDEGVVVGERTLKHFEQLEGTYTHRNAATEDGTLKAMLLKNFDHLFSQEISEKLNRSDFQTFHLQPQTTVMSHTITLTPATGISDVDKQVNIVLEVKDSYAIYITAYLEELDVYKIEAELTPNENKPTVPATLEVGSHSTQLMQWTLGWITVLDNEEGGTSGA